MIEIIYKEKVIDYEKTLAQLLVGQAIVIPTVDKDLSNIRSQVTKAKVKLPFGATFAVNKSLNGAVITRTA